MIELVNFSKIYPSQKEPSVSDFSMKCRQGKITGLLGLNGAGKTTVLKAICGRHFASGGKVLVDEIDASEECEKVRSITGFITEENDLPGEYKVIEYLKIVASLHGLNFKIGKSAQGGNPFSALVKDLYLEELLDKKIRSLSKGQKQRVNFARALIYSPSVLVIDEGTSGLDPAQILSMRKLIKSLKDKHTILLSTHLMQEVESLCDDIYIIHQGKCLASGSKEDILNQTSSKNFEEAFFRLTGVNGGAL